MAQVALLRNLELPVAAVILDREIPSELSGHRFEQFHHARRYREEIVMRR
ncbi:MAG: hypothetical protein ACKVQW_03950 [Pyrinomonadaceae bacterium]